MDLNHLVEAGVLPSAPLPNICFRYVSPSDHNSVRSAAMEGPSDRATPLSMPMPTCMEDGCKSVPVFILAGQSNMVGRGKPSDLLGEVVDAVSQCSLCYDHDRNFADKVNQPHLAIKGWGPLTPDAQYSYGGQCTHFGPEFGIASYLGYPVQFAKFAMGSTTLHTDWQPQGSYFRELVKFVKHAIKNVS